MLKIDSAQRATGTCSNFIIRLNQPMSGGFRVRAAYMPNSFYNINSGNNQLTFNSLVATVTPGFYSATDLATGLATAMNAVSSGYAVSYSSITGKFTITNATPFTLSVSSLSRILGLTAASPSATTQTTGVVNLSAVRAYNFLINDQRGGIEDLTTGNSWTFSIPCTVQSGEIQSVDFLLEAAPTFTLQRTSQLSVRIQDDYNADIPLTQDFYLVVTPL